METFTCHTILGDVTVKMNAGVVCYLQFESTANRVEEHRLQVQLNQYFKGEVSTLDVPYELSGTAFQMQVWDLLKQIPRGKTKTYAEIAKLLGDSKKVRAVGAAIGANPVLVLLPCHRVIASDGALQGYAGGLDRKQKLLTIEGVLQQTSLFLKQIFLN